VPDAANFADGAAGDADFRISQLISAAKRLLAIQDIDFSWQHFERKSRDRIDL
jgi:hypothetical protein